MAKHSALSKERQGKPRGETPGLDEVHSQQNARTAVARPTPPEPAPDLDRLIHERMRLGIVSALAVNQSMSFRDLKKLLNTTDGNLSVHTRKLEEAEYITCTKFFEGRLPKTEYRLTPTGKRALERYLNHMEALIKAMRER